MVARIGLLIGCGPEVPIVVFSRRGPDQDAGADGEVRARPEDEGIRTNDAPQGGGLDRALTLGPDPDQPGRHLEPGAGRPSAQSARLRPHEPTRRPCSRTPPRRWPSRRRRRRLLPRRRNPSRCRRRLRPKPVEDPTAPILARMDRAIARETEAAHEADRRTATSEAATRASNAESQRVEASRDARASAGRQPGPAGRSARTRRPLRGRGARCPGPRAGYPQGRDGQGESAIGLLRAPLQGAERHLAASHRPGVLEQHGDAPAARPDLLDAGPLALDQPANQPGHPGDREGNAAHPAVGDARRRTRRSLTSSSSSDRTASAPIIRLAGGWSRWVSPSDTS